jgi:hypothetical protein
VRLSSQLLVARSAAAASASLSFSPSRVPSKICPQILKRGVGGLGGRLTQASGSSLGSPGFGVGPSLAGEEGFFPIFGAI